MRVFVISGLLLAACAGARGLMAPALPLHFEQNVGQAASEARFVGRGADHPFWLGRGGSVLGAGGVRMSLAGGDPDAPAVGCDRLPARIRHLDGGGPAGWFEDIPAFAAVEYRGVYPGIDVRYYGRGGRLEYDFRVAPGADPAAVRLRFEGAGELRLEPGGDLVFITAGGRWRHHKLRIYQETAGPRRAIPGRYVLRGAREAGFEIGAYDHTRELVVDPVLTYSTYLGGTGGTAVMAIAVDRAGNAYVAGWAESSALAGVATRGGVDAFVARFDALGALVYLTYLGGSGDDRAFGVAVDGNGSAVVAGWTYSVNFPVAAPHQSGLAGGRDVFIAKLNPSGGLLFSTYLGGSAYDDAAAVAVDRDGNVYAAGGTSSANFPVLEAVQNAKKARQDAFVVKLSAAGALRYSTYLGGSAEDRGAGIAVDEAGCAYVAGATDSLDFPTLSAVQSRSGGGQDAFVAKLAAGGRALVYSTYLGGAGGTAGFPEAAAGIAVDAAGNAYVGGTTSSANFPVAAAVQPSFGGGITDAFMAKLNVSGAALLYSTYVGGTSVDFGTAVAVDEAGSACLAGYTISADFPRAAAVQNGVAGSYDAFAARLRPDGGAWLLATPVGGRGSDAAAGIAVDAVGGVLIAGQTLSTDFPVMAPAQPENRGPVNAFVTRIGAYTRASLDAPAPGSVLPAGPVAFAWSGASGALRYRLDVGTQPGGGDIASTVLAATSSTVPGIPPGGRTIYVRLWTELPGGWEYNDYTFTSAPFVKAELISPQPGSTLPAGSVTFTWTASPQIDLYWLDVGTALGWGNITAGTLSSTSKTVTGIPADGRTIYVRLWTEFVEGWQYNDYVFNAATSAKAVLTGPAPGSTLPGPSVTFTWTPSPRIDLYWLDVGTNQGWGDITAGTLAATAKTVHGIPTDGRTIYVRLWTEFPEGWQYNDYTFTAATFAKAVLVSPVPGSTLAGGTVTFAWTPSPQIDLYWLDVGTAQGQGNITAGTISGTSKTVTGIPADGRAIYVRLWTEFPGGWQYNDYTFTASYGKAVLTSPAPGGTLPGATVTFTWTPSPRVNLYWLDVGTVQGWGNITAGTLASTSKTVSGIPTDGRTIYARLWTEFPEGWQYNDYSFTAARFTKAVLVSPAPGSTLPGGTVTFTWTPSPQIDLYWLDVGTQQGWGDITGGTLSGTSKTVAGIPTDGRTIYVRLWTEFPGGWQYNDYVFTAAR